MLTIPALLLLVSKTNRGQ